MKILFPIIAALTWPVCLLGQVNSPDTIPAIYLGEKIKLDGKLDELVWQQATPVSRFIQRDPDFGQPATEKTIVAVVYTTTALYIGIWCYQSHHKIIAKSLQRDFDFTGEDNFKIVISPFNDGRTGYEFVINPNGARADLLIAANDDTNADWNGVWDAATTINDDGWFAEVEIPYNTLKFKNAPRQIWAINFERDISANNEQDRWQNWSRNNNLENFSQAGTLSGMQGIRYSQRFEFKPYVLAGWDFKKDTTPYTLVKKVGADLNYNITPALKLNLTVNTDFAQVGADIIQVNLTRFNLYYPEKRDFFLEGAGNFEFNLGNNNSAFYSRKIGLENFSPVDILGGVRLFGEAGKSNIGFLSLQTAAKDSVPTVNNTVLRYKFNIGEQSYIGAIITSKISTRSNNLVAGIDGHYLTSHFLRNKNLEVAATFAESFDNGKSKTNSLAYRIFVDYPNDLIDHFIAISSLQQNFDPQLGFLTRDNYNALNWHLVVEPRWFSRYGIKKIELMPWNFALFHTQSTGELESFNNETRPFGLLFKTGDEFQFNTYQSYDRVDVPFALTNKVEIGIGKYHMNNYEFQFNTFAGRRIFSQVLYNWGTLYDGNIQTLTFLLGVNVNKHLSFKEQYNLNPIQHSGINDQIRQWVSTIRYAFTNKIDVSLLTQYDSQEDQFLSNFNLHWIPKIGSDFYLVWNNGYDPLTKADYLRPMISNGAVKFVWRVTF
ncbi:DUF5916 domain-containing protein [Mucilaginibacter sp. McL0603]|uniref:carbohydrate binding family 9 domain-containing protein n=1 Tax=Mucilaginibacter sp. McL0603 TaxID=3415670 RepID=UPI003CE972E9